MERAAGTSEAPRRVRPRLVALALWILGAFVALLLASLAALAFDEWQAQESRERSLAQNLTAQSLLASSKDPATVARGARIFSARCAPCHGTRGEGRIGPNLTDGYWLHGGRPMEIFRTVSQGAALKGMPSWGPVLGTSKVVNAVAFVLTLKGTNLPGKAAQGAPEAR
jgi:cytochrome c oxidase cbb3-type subunit 3